MDETIPRQNRIIHEVAIIPLTPGPRRPTSGARAVVGQPVACCQSISPMSEAEGTTSPRPNRHAGWDNQSGSFMRRPGLDAAELDPFGVDYFLLYKGAGCTATCYGYA